MYSSSIEDKIKKLANKIDVSVEILKEAIIIHENDDKLILPRVLPPSSNKITKKMMEYILILMLLDEELLDKQINNSKSIIERLNLLGIDSRRIRENFAHLIDDLEKQRLLIRERRKGKEKNYKLYLTPKGKKEAKKILQIALKISEEEDD